MVIKRVMPCLLFNGKALVKTVSFKNPAYIGDPINAIKIYNEKEVDELILLDINATIEKREPNFEKIKEYASECFMPFTYGGGVSKIEHFQKLFSLGVEKVAVNSLLFTNPELVKLAVKNYGSQSIIGFVDFKFSKGTLIVFNRAGYTYKGTIQEYCHYLQHSIGVGEIVFQNVDKEGTWSGLDHEKIKELLKSVKVPVITIGGANNAADIKKCLYETGVNAVAIGSMAVYQKKDMGVLIRFPKRELMITE